jgi:5-formyltetrahydrofolate cyclo-ligase
MDKAAIRQAVRAKREAAYKNSPATIGATFAEQFLRSIPVPPQAVVAGYNRTQSEADPARILEALSSRGHDLVLPCVEGKTELVFRLFDANVALVVGPLGIGMPARTSRQVDPDLLIVPLLAFDRLGHRLGYGAGYYDRTLQKLRERKVILTVGLAYAVQEVDSIPHEAHDQRLDWIVTEREAIQARR